MKKIILLFLLFITSFFAFSQGGGDDVKKKTWAWIQTMSMPPATWGSITGTLSDQTDLNSALAGKQATLVSGTNIRTVEGNTLLGSTNIDLSKSDVGLGNVDNTSDADKSVSTATQAELDLKAALSMPSNTRTADYTLVLSDLSKRIEMNVTDGGDLTVPPHSSVPYTTGSEIGIFNYDDNDLTVVPGSGVTIRSSSGVFTVKQYHCALLRKRDTNEWYLVNGSPGQDLSGYVQTSRTINSIALTSDVVVPHTNAYWGMISGRGYTNAINNTNPTTVTLVANTLRAYPFIIPKAISVASLKTEVVTASGSTTYRVALYTATFSGSNIYPDALVANTDNGTQDSGTGAGAHVNTSTPGSALTIQPGLYFVAINSDGAPVIRAVAVGGQANVLGWNTSIGSGGQNCGYTVSSTYGAMPGTFPGSATLINGGASAAPCPIVELVTN